MDIIFNISRHPREFSVGRVEMDGERVVKKTDRRQVRFKTSQDVEIRVRFDFVPTERSSDE